MYESQLVMIALCPRCRHAFAFRHASGCGQYLEFGTVCLSNTKHMEAMNTLQASVHSMASCALRNTGQQPFTTLCAIGRGAALTNSNENGNENNPTKRSRTGN